MALDAQNYGALAPTITPAAPSVDVVLPVYNEEVNLERAVWRLHAFLSTRFPFTFRITIVDNGSTDSTWSVAQRLRRRLADVDAVHLDAKGRGRALRTVWSASNALVVAYMDVDLSTDLSALLPLVAPLLSGHSDVAIGTRLARAANVVRGPKREIISRCYNLLTRLTLAARVSDAQCGFKALRADRARELLPLTQDNAWFFDTELLVLAERAGLRIHEVPVDWVDDPDSRVEIVPTAIADMRGIVRLRRRLRRGLPSQAALAGRRPSGAPAAAPRLPHQLTWFCIIGLASTLAYAGIYLALREALPAQWANALALLVTAVANTAANRRLTFGVRGAAGRLIHQTQGLIVFVVGLAVTSGSLVVLHHADPGAGHTIELAILIAASAVATLLRFALFRVWIFRWRHAVATNVEHA